MLDISKKDAENFLLCHTIFPWYSLRFSEDLDSKFLRIWTYSFTHNIGTKKEKDMQNFKTGASPYPSNIAFYFNTFWYSVAIAKHNGK